MVVATARGADSTPMDANAWQSGLPPCVRQIMDQPTLFASGPPESFRGNPAMYYWLLDHPDQAMKAWRRLGAKCREITDRGDGTFTWTDGEGTCIRWETVYRDPTKRIWFAVGSSRPNPLLPLVPVRAVVVLHHTVMRDGYERPLLKHRADLYLQLDSRTAQVLAKLLGASAPRLAEQGLAQMELFFSGLVGFFERYPERALVVKD
jgi:hypothetical protein